MASHTGDQTCACGHIGWSHFYERPIYNEAGEVMDSEYGFAGCDEEVCECRVFEPEGER